MQTILISPAGGQAIHGVVTYFQARGIKVVGIDSNPNAIGRFFVDTFIRVPNVGDPPYTDTVLTIIRQQEIDIFISWLNPEIFFWNGEFYASRIPETLRNIFAFNFREDLIKFYDKLNFYTLVEAHGFRCPTTSLLEDDEGLRRIGLPVILKPRIGYGSKDTCIADSMEGYRYFTNLIAAKSGGIDRFLMQEYLEGDEYTVDFFSDKGKVINLAVRKRIEHRGVSIKGEVVFDEEIASLVKDFSGAFSIDGLNNIQVICSGNKHYITDFNPRPSGTIMLSINAGSDLLNNLVEKMEGREFTHYVGLKRLKMFRYLCEFYHE
jgi:carbamoyl-phosphate synthase large subunit